MNKLTEQELQKIANPGECDIGGTQSPIVTQIAAELLSLRAELAEIKGEQQPVAWGLVDKSGNAYMSECCIGEEGDMKYEAETQNDCAESEDDFISAVPLFTHPA